MRKIYRWQHKLWQKLTHHSQSGTNALLLKGRAGIGKLDFALNLAKFRLCENPSLTGEACGTCLSCGWFEKGGHPDFYQVSPEASANLSGEVAVTTDSNESVSKVKSKKKTNQQISIAQIRALSDFVYMTGHQRGQRIIIICPAEAMNAAAANALLKKLEEPPGHVLFILVAHRPQHLPATIRSRCQLINMPLPDIVQATRWLEQQGVNTPEACLAAASFAPLLALTFNDPTYVAQHDAFIKQISAPREISPIELAEKTSSTDKQITKDKLIEQLIKERPYTVRLYFSEPDDVKPGRRIFDVALQGKKVLDNFDIVKEAGGQNCPVVKEFKGVLVKEDLTVAFASSSNIEGNAPVISGIKAVAEEW